MSPPLYARPFVIAVLLVALVLLIIQMYVTRHDTFVSECQSRATSILQTATETHSSRPINISIESSKEESIVVTIPRQCHRLQKVTVKGTATATSNNSKASMELYLRKKSAPGASSLIGTLADAYNYQTLPINFEYKPDAVTHTKARQNCLKDGKTLLQLNDSNYTSMFAQLNPKKILKKPFWLDGTDCANEGTFKNTDGSEMKTGALPWNSTEPNNSGGTCYRSKDGKVTKYAGSNTTGTFVGYRSRDDATRHQLQRGTYFYCGLRQGGNYLSDAMSRYYAPRASISFESGNPNSHKYPTMFRQFFLFIPITTNKYKILNIATHRYLNLSSACVQKPASSALYEKIEEKRECRSQDVHLGNMTVDKCAESTRKNHGQFFIHGIGKKANRCYMELASNQSCPSGWESDDYDFYGLSDRHCRVSSVKSAADATVFSVKSNRRGQVALYANGRYIVREDRNTVGIITATPTASPPNHAFFDICSNSQHVVDPRGLKMCNDCSRSGEHCVEAIYRGNKNFVLNDLPCNVKRAYVCHSAHREKEVNHSFAENTMGKPLETVRGVQPGDEVVLVVKCTSGQVTLKDMHVTIHYDELSKTQCFDWSYLDNHTLPGEPLGVTTSTLHDARTKCLENSECVGFTKKKGTFTLHKKSSDNMFQPIYEQGTEAWTSAC